MGRQRRRADDLFEVVEDQQNLAFRQVSQKRLLRVHRAGHTNAERMGDRARHERWFEDRLERDEEDPVGDMALVLDPEFDGEARLAGTARAGERDEPVGIDQVREGPELPGPADQRGGGSHEVALWRCGCAQRRKLRRQPVDDKLVELLGRIQVLEPVASQVAQCNARWQVPFDETARGVREQNLAAVPRGGNARSAMDVEPDVVVAAQIGHAAVHPHSDPNRRLRGPLGRRERALRGGSAPDRIDGQPEHCEERIAFGRNLDATCFPDRLAHDRVVLLQERPETVPQAFDEAGRPLDVGKEEGDSPDRERLHGRRLRGGGSGGESSLGTDLGRQHDGQVMTVGGQARSGES